MHDPDPIAVQIAQMRMNKYPLALFSGSTVKYAAVGTMKHIMTQPMPPSTDNTVLISGRTIASRHDETEKIRVPMRDLWSQ